MDRTLRGHAGGFLLDLDSNDTLYIRCATNLGLLYNSPWCFIFFRSGKPVKIDNEVDLSLKLVLLNVPYSFMWYSFYVLLLDMNAFVGAEEIDKCIVWLLLVSTISAISVMYIPGPCVVINENDQDESPSSSPLTTHYP